MELKPNKYYPRQMNGPVISAFGEARDKELEPNEAIEDYLYNLSIATAQETELENIGRLIGYPRPLVPEGFNAENLLILGTLPLETDRENGLSTVGSSVGGVLSTTESSQSDFMSLGIYRKFLERIAYIKRYGLTLYSVDLIAALVAKDYTITWDENKDIRIHYNEKIGYKNLWILTQLFFRIATAPQVLITSGN